MKRDTSNGEGNSGSSRDVPGFRAQALLKVWLISCVLSVSVPLIPAVAAPSVDHSTNGPALKVGDPFPDLAGLGVEGELPRDLKGKVVIVDFWASWCGPCQESFPLMEDLYRKYRDQGLVVLAINVDESRSAMRTFLSDNPVSFPVVRDAKRRLVARVNVTSMPTSFLLDRKGAVRFMHPGYKGHETKRLYTREIEELLRQPATNSSPTAVAPALPR